MQYDYPKYTKYNNEAAIYREKGWTGAADSYQSTADWYKSRWMQYDEKMKALIAKNS
jgi:hypothetical protein